MKRLCAVMELSRASYYRKLRPSQPEPETVALRNQIQHIALRWPAYGYRRVHAELVRQGWEINHKRVLRMMGNDNLLCLRRPKFVFTTDSRHGLPIYPNLVARLTQPRSISFGWPISLTSGCDWSLSTWRSSWMRSRGA